MFKAVPVCENVVLQNIQSLLINKRFLEIINSIFELRIRVYNSSGRIIYLYISIFLTISGF